MPYPIESPAVTADKIVHSNNQHEITRLLDESGPNALAVLKEVQNEEKKVFGQKDLPMLVIAGLTDHLVHEASQGVDISAEYNQLSGREKQEATRDLQSAKTPNIHMLETPKGELESMTVDLAGGVSKIVYEKQSRLDQLKHLPGKVRVDVRE